ncbi:MAG: hypothetical protein ACR2OC_13155 [Solirubrobacterales bacterium]
MNETNRRFATLCACFALALGGAGIAGCGDDNEGPAEDAGSAIDNAADDAGNAIDENVDVGDNAEGGEKGE